MPDAGTVSIVNTAIQALPGILALIRANHQSPVGTPPPTDAEIVTALQQAVASSLAKDEQWLAAHPG